MRTYVFPTLIMAAMVVVPVHAVDFLGIELCNDAVSTAVQLPVDSPLTLESAEIGAHGALVLLLRSDDSAILDQIDDLMFEEIGSRGVGDEKSLQWSSGRITAFAQVLKKKMAALAINTSDDCRGDEAAATATIDEAPVDPSEPVAPGPEVGSPEPIGTEAVAPVIPAAVVVPDDPNDLAEEAEEAEEAEDEPAVISQASDFVLQGTLRHSPYDDDWVDVMGVVVNNTGESYSLAAFDLSMYDSGGQLICVDTISVAVLKSGQHRAFRDSIRCPGYRSDAVDRTELQFAGGR